jgi:murein hydrolase activator
MAVSLIKSLNVLYWNVMVYGTKQTFTAIGLFGWLTPILTAMAFISRGIYTNEANLHKLCRATFFLAWAMATAGLPAAFAQTVPTPPSRTELDVKMQELDQARQHQERIRAEIAEIAKEREKLAADLVATATRITGTETRITASEERLAQLQANEANIQKALEGRKHILAELLAALQRLGRNPPPALLVRPEDALASIRSAIVLGTILPDIRAEAEILASDLEEMARIRRESARERSSLEGERADLVAAQQRIGLLIEARQQRSTERQQALKDEQQRMEQLAREVKTFEELIARAEKELASAKEAAEAAAKAKAEQDAAAARNEPPKVAALGDSSRTSPAMPFEKTRGLLRKPVAGTVVHNFGDTDGFGGTHKGISLATRAGSQVASPVDGWVVYAGPFRSYGQLLILNAGDGYHVVLAGMEGISVSLGQFVMMGEPVARMGADASRQAAAVNAGLSRPVLYVEFRKDGQSIDSAPWWALQLTEKVRG